MPHAPPKAMLWLALLTVVLTAGLFSSTQSAAAAAPQIDGTSCGGTAPPNTYCSFETTGEDIVIGANSCTVVGSCKSLGNGVTIGDGSCNGLRACDSTGSFGGSSIIGDGSCNGGEACLQAGDAGKSTIGNSSCNGDAACWIAGLGGSSNIGDSSCNASDACRGAGVIVGSSNIGNGSCNGGQSCRSAASNGGSSNIGDGSCNGTMACFGAGHDNDSANIGANSCNYAPDTFASSCRNSTAPTGDCEFNDLPPEDCLRSVSVTKQFDLDESGDLSTGDAFVDGWAISAVCTSPPEKNGPYSPDPGVTGTDGTGTVLLTVPVNYVCVVTEATDILAAPVLPISVQFEIGPDDKEMPAIKFLNDPVELTLPQPPPSGIAPPAGTTPDAEPTAVTPPTVSVVEPTATPPGVSSVDEATPIAPDSGSGLAPTSGGSVNMRLLALALIALSGAAGTFIYAGKRK